MDWESALTFVEMYNLVINKEFSLLPKYYKLEKKVTDLDQIEIPENVLKVTDLDVYNAVEYAWDDYISFVVDNRD